MHSGITPSFARHIAHILPNYHTERVNNDIFFRCFRHVFSIGRRVFLPNKYAVVDKKPEISFVPLHFSNPFLTEPSLHFTIRELLVEKKRSTLASWVISLFLKCFILNERNYHFTSKRNSLAIDGNDDSPFKRRATFWETKL